MTNTANIRFEPSNVAYVAVDLDTHEMSGGVMDETTGTFYPVGGGGGISNPIIEVTFINNTGVPTGPLLHIFDENDNDIKRILYAFPNGATEVINTVVFPTSFDGPEGPFTYFEEILMTDVTITASDAVNCTFDIGDSAIIVTDPSKNGSITLTLS